MDADARQRWNEAAERCLAAPLLAKPEAAAAALQALRAVLADVDGRLSRAEQRLARLEPPIGETGGAA